MSSPRAVWRFGLCACLLALTACSRDPETRKHKYYESGRRYFEQEKYGEAVIEFRRALHQDRLFGAARFQLAESYTAMGNTRLAFPEYVRAADILTSDPVAQLKAGRLLVKGGFFEEAKERARLVLTKDPKNVEALALLGNALAGLKDLDDAVGVIGDAVTIDPERAGIYANLGVFELAQGDLENAEAAFAKAAALEPRSIEGLINLGQFYRTVGRRTDAEAVFNRALAVDVQSERANRAIGSLYVEWGRWAEAETNFKRVADHADTPEARFALADFYVGAGNFAEATRIFKELSAEPKQFAAALSRLAALEFAQGHPEQGQVTIDAVLKREPRNATAQLINARLLLAAHRFDDAAAAIKITIEKNPDSANAYLTLGRIEAARHHNDAARQAFNEAMRREPRSLPASLELSEWYRANDNFDTAIRMAEQAVRNYPANVAARLTLIRALMARPADRQRADTQIALVKKAYPDLPRLQGLIGAAALARNDLRTAGQAFGRELSIDPKSVEALAGLVAIDLSRGQVREARARVDAALAKHPDAARILVLSAKVSRAAGDIAKTESMLVRAIELDPSNPEAFAMLGHLYLAQGKAGAAKAKYEEAATLRPNEAGPPTMLGLLNYAEGNRDQAWRWWQRAVDLDSDAAAAANNLAWLATEMGKNLDTALQLSLRALTKMPEQPEFIDTVGWIYHLNHSSAQAVFYLKQSAEKDSDNPVYQYHLGMAYAQLGEDSSARRHLKQALAIDPQFRHAADAKRAISNLVY